MKFPSKIKADNTMKPTIWVKEGESVNGVFRGDIHEYKIHWAKDSHGKIKKITCLGGSCDLCGSGHKAAFQFRVNFVHKNQDGELIASIFEQDWFTYNALAKLNDKVPIEKNMIKMSNIKDGQYRKYVFEKVSELPETILKQIDAIPLQDLQDTQSPYASQETSTVAMDDVPF